MSRTLYTTIGLARSSNLPLNSCSRVVYTSLGRRDRNGKSGKPDLKQQLTAYIQHQHASRHFPATKMSFLLPGLRRGLILSTPLILSAPLLLQYRYSTPIRCDGPDPLTKITNDLTRNYASEAKTPIITESGAGNPRAIRQVSMGSILGVLCGLGISVFSKPLAILIGLGIFAIQVSIFGMAWVLEFSMSSLEIYMLYLANEKPWTDLQQAIESRGIHIIPYSFLQRRFKQTNVRSLVRDNVAFKLSFGLTFALAAFAEF